MDGAMKVGALARATGLTVRTLHHYDEIGLLTPTGRTPSGHRLYGATEVRRLQAIASLRHLGLPLGDIKKCLEPPGLPLARVLELQLRRIAEDVSRLEELRERIELLRDRLKSGTVSIEEITRTIEVTMEYSKYYTPDQLEQLERRREEVGDDRIREVQQEWTELFARYRAAMEEGLDPGEDTVQELARKSAALIEEFTGGDPGIFASLSNLYRTEGGENVMERHGMEMPPGLWEYMGKAREALGEE